jgi:type I restriction enzyme S subunit
MEATLIEKLSIDKTNWTPVKFGDVAFEPKDSSKNPTADAIEHVVGLEHIESGNIHLRNSAGIAESTTFTKRFAIGDVLFGRRRAYLKKAAQASFSGICSGDITVFRAKKNLLPELLPFIVSNERFFDYAIKHSAGGLSPRVKFKDLANYEFLLPPQDQQAQLAELLWAMDEVIERDCLLLDKLNEQKIITSESLLTGKERVCGYDSFERKKESRIGNIPVSWNLFRLKEILKKGRLGGNYPNSENESGLPLIKMGNLSRGKIILEKVQYVPEGVDYDLEDVLKDGDLLFNTRNTLELVGKVSIWKNELQKALYNSNIMRFEFNKNLIASNDFMNFVFNSRGGVNQLRSFATGTTSVAAIYLPELMRFRCAIPSINEQKEIVKIVDQIIDSINILTSKLKNSKSLQKSLINQIF